MVLQEAEQEIEQVVGRILGDYRRGGRLDLEASETAVRAVMHKVGGSLLEKLLNAELGYRGAKVDCHKGHHAKFIQYRSKQLVTVLSDVSVERAYYYCAKCGSGVIPKDEELDITGTSFSPGVRRMMGRVGGKEPFDEGALEHLSKLAKLLYGQGSKKAKRMTEMWSAKLKEGDVESLITSLKRLRPLEVTACDAVAREIAYFLTNAERMRYGDFRRAGLFVGSGVVEAGCKTVIGHRLKQSGMHWTVRGANSIIWLRCCQMSGRWEEYWEASAIA